MTVTSLVRGATVRPMSHPPRPPWQSGSSLRAGLPSTRDAWLARVASIMSAAHGNVRAAAASITMSRTTLAALLDALERCDPVAAGAIPRVSQTVAARSARRTTLAALDAATQSALQGAATATSWSHLAWLAGVGARALHAAARGEQVERATVDAVVRVLAAREGGR